MTITEFLLARIAEDEAWANAAIVTPGATHWHWVDGDTDVPVKPDPFTQEYLDEDGSVSLRTVEELREVSWEGGDPLPDFLIYGEEIHAGAGAHIARHDPARVLAECEAKRWIVRLESSTRVRKDAPAHVRGWDGEQNYVDIEGRRLLDSAAAAFIEEWYESSPPSLVLCQLATVYADHPDYRGEWRP